jgi:predicted SnoaL-like aldol condensation-catalyzing enzyme
MFQYVFDAQRAYFATKVTRTYEWRVQPLDRTARLLLVFSLLLLLTSDLVWAQMSDEDKRIDAVRALLKSIETKDQRALRVISSTQFIQHDARVPDGRDAFTAVLLGAARGTTVRTARILADGDYVVAQSEYHLSRDRVVFDVFRFEEKEIVEHWDNAQDTCPAPNVSGRTQLDGPTQVLDLAKTDTNKALMNGYFRDVVLGGQSARAVGYKSQDLFHQHNCDGVDNPTGLQPKHVFKITTLHKVLGQGNFVLMMSDGVFDGQPTAFYDLYRMDAGKQVEHWDVLEAIPPSSEWKNANGKF